MNLADYDYNLPVDLIAQKPLNERDRSRLMVLHSGATGGSVKASVEHSFFCNLPEFLEKRDLLVLNDTRVFSARLIGTKEKTGGEAELLLLHHDGDDVWEALSRPSKRLREGSVILFGNGRLRAEIVEKGQNGHVRVRLSAESDRIEDVIDAVGITPLPPYIKRMPDRHDRDRYQTVYARERGAVAAPTAGLHFSEELLETLKSRGIGITSVTLHVGIGTFRPLSEQDADKDRLHHEYCRIPPETVHHITACRKRGGRVVAIGTTTARALETASVSGYIAPFEGWTDLFIKPPYRFVSVDVLITNFHLPRSSLLLMVSAFAGKERIFEAYREAISERYRFYSYGDAMLIFGALS